MIPRTVSRLMKQLLCCFSGVDGCLNSAFLCFSLPVAAQGRGRPRKRGSPRPCWVVTALNEWGMRNGELNSFRIPHSESHAPKGQDRSVQAGGTPLAGSALSGCCPRDDHGSSHRDSSSN